MSTNVKNVVRPEYLKNFTTKIKRRYVVIENSKGTPIDFQKIINSINTRVNQTIQEINLKVTDRQIPYITLIAQYTPDLNERSRIVIHNQRTTTNFIDSIKEQSDVLGESISHCVDLLIAPGYKEITISSLQYDAKIVVANEFVECAIIDMLLDIAMFNSYSFLKEKNVKWKHDFSFRKFEHYKKKEYKCFYDCKSDENLYYSFAFSARKTKEEFNVVQYIKIWNDFIKENFARYRHREKSIPEQLQQHVDFRELPNNLVDCFDDLPVDGYLVLRTNKERTEDLQPFICTLFGIDEYEKGKIKIVPINDFDKYKSLLENLDVSAFKIVKSPSKKKSIKNTKPDSKKDVPVPQNPPSTTMKNKKRFKIALSFPGEHRSLVREIANGLISLFDKESILYDENFRSEFARPNLDIYLQNLYTRESELIVIFMCEEYDEKLWCGAEWRSIRSIMNEAQDNRIMLLKCGTGSIKGIYNNIDGYIDATTIPVHEIVQDIAKRYYALLEEASNGN